VRVLLVSNLREEKGLAVDASIVGALLRRLGHDVDAIDFRAQDRVRADLAIHFEVKVPRLAGPRTWLIPNPEWWQPEWPLDGYERVLCKTPHALHLFENKTRRAVYTGFMSEDHGGAAVPRERRFLHVAGGSMVKGTDSILDAWEQYRIAHPLTVIGTAVRPRPIARVEFRRRVEADALATAQCRAAWHLCPSQYEGWGHTLHEALGCGATVMTTAGPPMADVAGVRFLIPIAAVSSRGLAPLALVSAASVAEAVEQAAAMTDAEIEEQATVARAAYERERAEFEERFAALFR
jgi:hypothetical protein